MRILLSRLFSKPPAARKGAVNYGAVDRFTFVHFAIGLAYGWLGLSFWTALFLASLWEVVENPLKFNLPRLFPHATADTLQNLVGDMIAVMTGWLMIDRCL